jgi:hypothetical protein
MVVNVQLKKQQKGLILVGRRKNLASSGKLGYIQPYANHVTAFLVQKN